MTTKTTERKVPEGTSTGLETAQRVHTIAQMLFAEITATHPGMVPPGMTVGPIPPWPTAEIASPPYWMSSPTAGWEPRAPQGWPTVF